MRSGNMYFAGKKAEFISAYKVSTPAAGIYVTGSGGTLSYKVSGVTKYYQNETVLTKSAGMVVYMPAYATFSTEITEPGEYIEVRFQSDELQTSDLMLFSGFNVKEMENAFRRILAYSLSSEESSYYSCQSELFNILSILARCEEGYISAQQRKRIAPAVKYMDAHILDRDFSIGKMEENVDISPKYFRKLFTEYYGVPPQAYVTGERIHVAIDIMISHPSLPMQNVAEAVGYQDAYYFSRVFKKEMGMAPKQFMKNHFKEPDNK